MLMFFFNFEIIWDMNMAKKWAKWCLIIKYIIYINFNVNEKLIFIFSYP